MTSYPYLPTELILQIIRDSLDASSTARGSQSLLSTFSLVSPLWLSLSQPILFRHPHLSTVVQARKFAGVVEGDEELASWVRGVEFGENGKGGFDAKGVMGRIMSRCEKVQVVTATNASRVKMEDLSGENNSTIHISSSYLSPSPTFSHSASQSPSFPSLTHLSLISTHYTTLSLPPPSSIPLLTSLFLSATTRILPSSLEHLATFLSSLAPQLNSLSLENLPLPSSDAFKNLQTLQVSRQPLPYLQDLPPSVRSLELSSSDEGHVRESIEVLLNSTIGADSQLQRIVVPVMCHKLDPEGVKEVCSRAQRSRVELVWVA